jgi:anti-sigma regulatory factor (Ser/Thr protein kinase)
MGTTGCRSNTGRRKTGIYDRGLVFQPSAGPISSRRNPRPDRHGGQGAGSRIIRRVYWILGSASAHPGATLPAVSDSQTNAPIPCIDIPRHFEGATLSKLADAIVTACPDNRWPPELMLDFHRLDFIQPAGVIFLSNLIWWLNEQGTEVHLVNANRDVEALRYLDDSRFFEQHCGAKIWERSQPRRTTLPFQRIAPSHSHDWLEHTLLPWLVINIGLTQASFFDLKTCISELFNNIREHTLLEIGSIFVQHYPKRDRINISLADFGLGIPQKVREVRPKISDTEAVILAVQEGFTTKSIPGNAGLGLDLLLKTVVGTNSGEVTILRACNSAVLPRQMAEN